MVQTLHQRKANEKFAKSQEKKMGKPESAIKRNDKSAKTKIPGIWLKLIVFAVLGGLLLEFVRLIWSRLA